MLIQESVNTILQVLVVFLVAGLFYLLAGRKRGGFGQYTGLLMPTSRSMIRALIAAVIIVPIMLAPFYFTPLSEIAVADNTVAGELRAQGFSTEIIAVILLVAVVKTSFTEELLFRGLIAKRLIRWLGFGTGNVLQAALFGAVHMLIFMVPGAPEFALTGAAIVFGVTALAGWVNAWLNERVGNGSMAPGWLLHALTNLTSYPLLAFG